MFFYLKMNKIWEKEILQKSENKNKIKFSEEKEISRKNLEENYPRENVKIRDFLDLEENFQEINEKKFKIISEETEKLTFETNFNNFSRLRWIIKLFKIYNEINPENKENSMKKAYDNMSTEINLKNWTNCSGMWICLKKILEERWINSYLVRFSAFWYINDNYIKDWHSGLIIPAKINNEKKFIFVDPGIRIFKPIIFDEKESLEVFCDWKIFSIIKKENDSEFDFSLKSISNDKKERFLDFNSKQEWLNPDETLIPQSVRSRQKYKIQKFNKNENILLFFDIEKNEFSLQLHNNLEIITFEEFFKIFWKDEVCEKKKLFFDVFEKLWENKEEIISDIFDIIENLEIFKKVVLNPSSKEIIEKRKNLI